MIRTDLHYDSPSMRRRLVAIAWIVGTTLPAVVATAFLIGCCVLPLHGVLHRIVPLCEMAASMVRGEHDRDDHEHDALPPAPARDKRETVKQIATDLPLAFRLAGLAGRRVSTPTSSTSYRSFVSLGALRCDEDVGLNTFIQTFRI